MKAKESLKVILDQEHRKDVQFLFDAIVIDDHAVIMAKWPSLDQTRARMACELRRDY